MIVNFFSPTKEDFKERKNAYIDKLEMLCRNSPISDKNLGAWIRAYHFNLPVYIYLAVFFTSKTMADIALFGVLFILLSFIYLRGCWLSLLERRICTDDVNIVDAWIEWIGIKPHYDDKTLLNKQRYKATFIIGGIWLSAVLITYYLRFYH